VVEAFSYFKPFKTQYLFLPGLFSLEAVKLSSMMTLVFEVLVARKAVSAFAGMRRLDGAFPLSPRKQNRLSSLSGRT